MQNIRRRLTEIAFFTLFPRNVRRRKKNNRKGPLISDVIINVVVGETPCDFPKNEIEIKTGSEIRPYRRRGVRFTRVSRFDFARGGTHAHEISFPVEGKKAVIVKI